jgi:hypothetical protein
LIFSSMIRLAASILTLSGIHVKPSCLRDRQFGLRAKTA